MTHETHEWRVIFGDGVPARHVYATSRAGALATARRAEQMISRRRVYPISAEDLGHRGSGAEHCRTCRLLAPGLFTGRAS
jgi:hypothetical protein